MSNDDLGQLWLHLLSCLQSLPDKSPLYFLFFIFVAISVAAWQSTQIQHRQRRRLDGQDDKIQKK